MFGSKKEGEGGSWRVWLIVIGALCGVLLLVFGSGLGSRSDRNAAPAETVGAEEELAAYRTSLAADIRAPTKLQSTAAAIMPSVSRSIFPPVRSR